MPLSRSVPPSRQPAAVSPLARVLAILPCVLALAACRAPQAAHDAPPVQLSGPGVAVYAAGDIAACGNRAPYLSGAAKTARIIEAGLAQDPDALVLALGDSTYPVGRLEEFVHCYDPTWGRFKDRTRPIPGNHEYYLPGAIGYFRYFEDRPWAQGIHAHRAGYYSYDIGKWHVVALNSMLRRDDWQRQLAWLRADLAAHPAKCTLAYWHHPFVSSGGHGSNDDMRDLWKALEEAGAELVLSAHDHNYERFVPIDSAGRRDDARGIVQFVVGTGGAKTTPMRFKKWHSVTSYNDDNGVLKLVLRDDGYEWEFLGVEKDGYQDRGAAACR